MIYSRIAGTGSYLPKKVLTNHDLEKMVETSHEWIVERTGIHQRHIVSGDETVASMATEAARRAIEAAGISPNDIEFILTATTTPDKLLPNTSCLVQNALGITNNCMAFDIFAACGGFNYGLSIADKYIRTGAAKYALVIGCEALSRITDWTDRATCILFADGAGAAVLKADSEPGILSTHSHAAGRYKDLLYAELSWQNEGKRTIESIHMLGREVFKEAVNKLGEVVQEALAANNMQGSEVDWLVPHQANIRIIQGMAKKLNLPMERVVVTVQDHGNTSSASVPLALDVAIRDGRIQRGQTLLLESLGGGLTWGAALIKY